MTEQQYNLYEQEQDGPDYASIQEAEAILKGEIPADENTKNAVRSWLSKQVTWAAAMQVGRCEMLREQIDRDALCYCGDPKSRHVMERVSDEQFPREVCKTYGCVCGKFESKKADKRIKFTGPVPF